MMTRELYLAIAASMNNQHGEAIEKLLAIIEKDKTSWWAWFYLGVSYNKTSRKDEARHIFTAITSECQDEILISHADKALVAMNLQEQQATVQQASVIA
jgi:tetratricopeptide (TPR) repeat protein